MIIGVPKETFPGEKRVALVPTTVPALKKAGLEVLVQAGAGEASGFLDGEFEEKGSKTVTSREEVFKQADVILQVRLMGANPVEGGRDLELIRPNQVLIGFNDPLSEPEAVKTLAHTGATVFAMELVPRITRAQGMDALSSMATIAGYKAVIVAASHLVRIFPMLMTAAGTIAAAKVLVIGAGVAGLQAIATSRRLGAIVSAYDLRPAVKEQVMSLGAKFVELELEALGAEDKGGYAREMGKEFYEKQREMMVRVVGESDVVISTAAIPGKRAPILITKEMVDGMNTGSVIVDLAAERGGNCEITMPGETLRHGGVTVAGPINLASTVPSHASQMYSKNISTFLLNMVKEGKLDINLEDEIISETLMAKDRDVVSPRIRELLGVDPTDLKGKSTK